MRKKLFAVIMSVMMMVTFMPTMAFAASEAKWADDNSYYQDDTGNKYKNVQKFINVTKDDDGEYNWTDGQVWIAAFNNNDDVKATKFLGYDLSTAFASELKVSEGATPVVWKEARKQFEAGELSTYFGTESMVNVTKVSFNMPSDVAKIKVGDAFKKAEGKTVNAKEVKVTELKGGDDGETNFTGTVSFKSTTPNYNPDKKYEDQEFTLYLNPYFSNADTGKYFYGDTQERKIVVLKNDSKKAAELTTADYEFDGKVITYKPYYNGGEHKLVQKEYAGVTSTYKMLNEKTGKYEDVEGDVVLKNAGTYHIIAKVANASDSKDTNTIYFDLTIQKADKAYVIFKRNGNESVTNVAGKFDATKYLTVTCNTPNTSDDKYKATKKAVVKDEKEILKYFNEVYDIELVDKGDGYQTATAEKKDLTQGEMKAIEDKYADLIGNYDSIEEEAVTTFKVIDNITFTKAPLKKTYNAKKGKLPKNKTFYVKAKAASGATLVYKIKKGAGKITVNANTGKVTVKKGLKKGTYNVTVKAIILDTFGWGDEEIYDSYSLKIKVK